MTCRSCDETPCICAKPAVPSFRSTYRPYPDGITLEEFGVDLFNAIRLESGRRWCVEHGEDERAKALQQELEPLLRKLKPEEVRRVLKGGEGT